MCCTVLRQIDRGEGRALFGSMISLTDRAARQVEAMHRDLNAPEKVLRVLIETGGVFGFPIRDVV